MFEITAEEIAQLDDTSLRELVGLLCEAELTAKGLSSSAVTYGGNQRAPDGGLDVRVALPIGAVIEGFIPKWSVGFQVKTPDMRRTNILAEMKPNGLLRPAILELASEAGAYIIVSSKASTSDTALGDRRDAMREALSGASNAADLSTDFYDRTRLASWVRLYPGLIKWVKTRAGRAVSGWQPYGSWAGGDEPQAEYLLDEHLRVRWGGKKHSTTNTALAAVNQIRDELRSPRQILRLVGLSGVGKTRFAQALFDERVGDRALAKTRAIYTNLSDNPSPQPIGLASDLIANGKRAVLIVDNCPPELHRRLAEFCSKAESTVSVLTIEYDVRDDLPEGTQVISLEPSSNELIGRLIARRFPRISQVDARTVAEASGGNARIAMAIAGTVENSETLAGLTNEELFQRLFQQRSPLDNGLLRAGRVCSLLYSFQGQAFDGTEAELPALASLAGQTTEELYRNVTELTRRDLVQSRGVWRALLPHAIANRLAAQALEDTHPDIIEKALVSGGSDRIARSFSRRLAYLHDHPVAIEIIRTWLAPDGLLGDVGKLNDLGHAMFQNIAPISPELTLAAIERGKTDDPPNYSELVYRYRHMLRSLAYDPALFESAACFLAEAAITTSNGSHEDKVADIFASLFTIYLSGTHATIAQRLALIDQLIRSEEPKKIALGIKALQRALQTNHFVSSHQFEFGARSRDYGFEPRTQAELTSWFNAVLDFIGRSVTDGLCVEELRELVGANFRGLWTSALVHDQLEEIVRKFQRSGYWVAGWIGCRQALRFDKGYMHANLKIRLETLEAELRPSNVIEKVQALVLGRQHGGLDFEDSELDEDAEDSHQRLEKKAERLGEICAADTTDLEKLLPFLFRGEGRLWSFGRGMAKGAHDPKGFWEGLCKAFAAAPSGGRNATILCAYLFGAYEPHRETVQAILDEALDHSVLGAIFPILQGAVPFDSRGFERLKTSLGRDAAPLWTYGQLAYGRATEEATGTDLRELLLLIAEKPDGVYVAMNILKMRLFADRTDKREILPELLQAGADILRRVTFRRNGRNDDYHLAELVRTCLTHESHRSIAAEIVVRLKSAIENHQAAAYDYDNMLSALLERHSFCILDAIFPNNQDNHRASINVFDYLHEHQTNPADAIPVETLVAWCKSGNQKRFLIAAKFVTFGSQEKAEEPIKWSAHAQALIHNAPLQEPVLRELMARFEPMSWSGSRAAIIERNAGLLDDHSVLNTPELQKLAAEMKIDLLRCASKERERENARDKERDERFE